ncbi:putative AAA family ATPase [Taphrina deformans PYCC 5710]|uniref:AAA family ATPase n=1 Tax=Taphrina deformans (strain PYCC 5710 / ATCC 11124 / CBS 356.35 / IMI 108563 / JCM 9778 / NBRC 8474) TaxID=1097556 RepID=R4XB53_TAPDE|nr:putative AAA family ATPase [Taphrina deformans PYCC 5710]|eukprot:CCG83104.2 putative AAA family ATPase [Taphrina deformans PYCC 5710]
MVPDDHDMRSSEYSTNGHDNSGPPSTNRHIVKLNVRGPNGHGDFADRETSPKVEFASEDDNIHIARRRSSRHDGMSRAGQPDGEVSDNDKLNVSRRKQMHQDASAQASDDDESVELYTPRKSSRRSRPLESGDSDENETVRQSGRLSRRLSDSRLKSRSRTRTHSDEDEYVDGEESEEGEEDIISDDSLVDRDNIADFVEDDERPSRKQRRLRHASTQQAQHNKRRKRATRAVRSDDDFSGGSSPTDLQAELKELRPEREERRRELRDRTNRPDYAIPPPFTDQMLAAPMPTRKKDLGLRSSFRSLYPEYGSLGIGLPNDNKTTFGNFGQPTGLQSDTDSSDEEGQTSKTTAKAVASALLPAMKSLDQSGTGGPNNLGKIKGSNLADAEPIGIDKTVSFDSVGGLQDHIDQLKEMVSLPLLYPEIFERFHITPPRGVLFHGPPGTGKTLMARALAASCSSEGRKISFYMRKGADCLSKWVGEAERQLRLLFDEAKANQPSIIFFDEIDGLAPVRSAKQDQIHASIVSTLLALMDGMDARGQVVVIGATNRPDSVDPALRRPGRFDREFYFPLPALEARSQILSIHTSKWTPPLEAKFVAQLATQTKGYGGADLRALCTEAALNAVQRRYPQIYMSSEKLVIDPATISIVPGDFTSAINKIIPSSARSTASGAAILPKHLQPLLSRTLDRITEAIDSMIPRTSVKTALERNLYVNSSALTFEQENMRQSESSIIRHIAILMNIVLQNMRTYRPRILVSGSSGSGQQHLGRAVLHHLEGYHVQNIDLAMLFSDSASTAEASLIQAFTEAKRHKPSILFMPCIELWFQTASDSVVSTLRSLLSTIGPNEPLLLLAISDTVRSRLPTRITEFFGHNSISNIHIELPTEQERSAFFEFLASYITKSPAEFPGEDLGPKRKLELLAIAPPVAPREPTKAERKATEARDKKTKLALKARLGPLMELIRTRYKRFKKPIIDERHIAHLLVGPDEEIPMEMGDRDYEKTEDGMILENSTGKKFYNMDINLIEERLWNNLYLSPKQFQSDIEQILHDVQQEGNDRERLLKAQEMHTNVLIHLEEMFDTSFLEECKHMAMREVSRHQKFLQSVPQTKLPEVVHQLEIAPEIVGESRVDSEDMLNASTGAPINSDQSTQLNHGATESVNMIDQTAGFVSSIDAEMLDDSHATKNSSEVGQLQIPGDVMAVSQMTNHDADRPLVPELGSSMQHPDALPKEPEQMVAVNPRIVDASEASLATAAELEDQHSAQVLPVSDSPADIGNHNKPLVEHEPYQLDATQLTTSLKRWNVLTTGFNIDQLEQLNSFAIDLLWTHRLKWDRNEVLQLMASGVEHIIPSLAADFQEE